MGAGTSFRRKWTGRAVADESVGAGRRGGASATCFACEGRIAQTRRQCDTSTLRVAACCLRSAVHGAGRVGDWHHTERLTPGAGTWTEKLHCRRPLRKSLGCVHECVHTQRGELALLVETHGAGSCRCVCQGGLEGRCGRSRVAGGLLQRSDNAHTYTQTGTQ